MLKPRNLPQSRLAEFVTRLQHHMYHDEHSRMLYPDKEVNGAALVDLVNELMAEYRLVPPEDGEPAD